LSGEWREVFLKLGEMGVGAEAGARWAREKQVVEERYAVKLTSDTGSWGRDGPCERR
jgi:hypothetical protein